MKTSYPLLFDVLPELATRIKTFFLSTSRIELSDQVEQLRIKRLCECGEPDCGSFYLTTYTTDNEEVFEGFNFEDMGSIDVYEGKIGHIEIFPSLYGFAIRSKLKESGISGDGIKGNESN